MTQRYISYRRVSKQSQMESGLGLASQLAIIKHFYPTVEKDFCDVKTGASIDRPQLQAAIKYCKENNAILVVAKADRLSRNVRHALQIYDELETRIRFCDVPGDPPERFILTIHFAISERERELISIRIKAAIKVKKERGDPLGTQITINKDGKLMDRDRLKKANQNRKRQALEPDENIIRAIRFAQSLREQNMTFAEIATELNRHSFATSTGGKWSAGSVCRVVNRIKELAAA